MPATPLRAAFSAVARTASGSMSTAATSAAPCTAAATASTPLPHPMSATAASGSTSRSSSLRHMRVVGWAPLPNARPGSIDSTTSSAPTHDGASCHAGTTTKRPPARHGRANSRHRSRSSSPSTGSTSTSARPLTASVTAGGQLDGHAGPQLDEVVTRARALLDTGHAGAPEQPGHQVGVVGPDPGHDRDPGTLRGGHSLP